MCGDDSEILRHSCGYLTDCSESRTINIDRLVEDRLLVLAKNKSIFNAKVLHVNKNKLNQWTIGLIYDKYGIDGIDTLSRILCKKEKWNNMYTVFSYMLLIENWNKK